jgi:hypothetical protein
MASLIPRTPRVVSQRYTGHQREVTTVGVGALTEDTAESGELDRKIGSRRPAESVRKQ